MPTLTTPNMIDGCNSFGHSYCRSFAAISSNSVFVLGSDDNLWLEHGPFGTVPPQRHQVDGNVQAFQWIDSNTAYVLGRDGNLWLEYANADGVWNQIPRDHVDGNVQALQALDTHTVFVLGSDGKLWREHAGGNGKFGQVPPPRDPVVSPSGAALSAFQAIDANTVFVLDVNEMLYLVHLAGGPNTPTEKVGAAVSTFQAYDADTVFLIEPSDLLYLQRATSGPNGRSWLSEAVPLIPALGFSTTGFIQAVEPILVSEQPDGSVAITAYVLDNTPDDIFGDVSAANPVPVTGGSALTAYSWTWVPGNPGSVRQTGATAWDYHVLDFSVAGHDPIILGQDGNLWLASGPASASTAFPPIPQRVQIDGNVAAPLAHGAIRPRFSVLDLIYAPPGTQGGKSQSNVAYSSDSSTGVQTQTTQSFKAGLDIKASLGSALTGTASVDFSMSQSDTQSISITQVTDVTNKQVVPGPPHDGIDHYYDLFCLWLNPTVHVVVDTRSNLDWQLDPVGNDSTVFVYAGELLGTIPWRTDIKAKLDAAGLGPNDYIAILNLNPFTPPPSLSLVTHNPAPPPNYQPASLGSRFHQLSVPSGLAQYAGPPEATATPPLDTYTISNSTDTQSSDEEQTQVGLTVGWSSPSISGPITASFSMSENFQWTYTNKHSLEQKTTQTASVSIGGAAYGYSGPTTLNVYWDTMFNTFAFELVN